MAEEKGGAGGTGGGGGGESARVSPSFVAVGGRQRFTVELRPGETTIVSWKKLVKDASKVSSSVPTSAPEPPTNAHPALESRIAPGQAQPPAEEEVKDEPSTHRFSAVIEKIERLYMGKHSSDEEDLNDIPDDDEYDTEDSFIDDTELDEYFQVDNSSIKHDGFFVNRGKLERMSDEPTSSPHLQPKKRRRKDLERGQGENADGDASNKQVKVGKKAVGKLVPSVGKSFDSPNHTTTVSTQYCEDVKLQSPAHASDSSKKKPTDIKASWDPPPSKVSNGDPSLSLVDEKDIEKQKVGAVSSKNHGSKLKDGADFSDPSYQRTHGKSSSAQVKAQSGKLSNNVDESEQLVQRRDKSGIRDRPDIDVSEAKHSIQTAKVPLMHRKEGSSTRPKSTMLEKSIRELHKMVAEVRPPIAEAPDADNSSQAIKKRLPPEVKQKLAKVARLAASQGKISKELINRLMDILGHLMQLRTLKRNLKLMVNMGLSAKQEKDVKFQLIKKEVAEMIKTGATSSKPKAIEHQAGSSDDFQEVVKKKYSMDDTLEEKICDLYDLFVEGLDEDAGPQVRKLYAELAELWPNGCMDNHGIKRAICRAKDRRRALYSRHKEQEKIKRKKLLASRTEEIARAEASSVSQPQHIQEKTITDSGNQSFSLNRPVSNITATTSTSTAGVRAPGPLMNNPSIDRPKQEKLKVPSSNSSDPRTVDGLAKKKVKRKPELELGETHFRPEKLSSAPGEERNKLHKQAPILALPQKPNLQASAHLPGSEQLG